MVEQVNELFQEYIKELCHYDEDWDHIVVIMIDKAFNVAMTTELRTPDSKVWSFPNMVVDDVTYQQTVRKCFTRYGIKCKHKINTSIQTVFQVHNILYITMHLDAFESPVIHWVPWDDFGKLLTGQPVNDYYARSAICKHLGSKLWKHLQKFKIE
jgi:hypothetical protein